MISQQFDSPVRVGLVGCGNVSARYLQGISGSPAIQVVACADNDGARARTAAKDHDIRQVMTPSELLGSPEVDLVLNLTPPAVHAAVTLQGLRHNKHVYTEKPLATRLEDAENILREAESRGVFVGCAPDTFLGAGVQTIANLIRDGEVGTPFSVEASFISAGPERFHPDPEFLYQEGAGPLFDIGPYYVSVLTTLFGAVTKVMAVGGCILPLRTVATGPQAGKTFMANTNTHIQSLLCFSSGVFCSLTTSFEVQATRTPNLEIRGSAGTIVAGEANSWGGPVLLQRSSEDQFSEILPLFVMDEGYMGMGLVAMAEGLLDGTVSLESGRRGLHTLQVLRAIEDSVETGGRLIELV